MGLNSLKKSLSALLVLLICVGCTKKQPGSPESNSNSTEGSVRVVNLAIWSNYLSPQTISEFEKKSGIKVHVSNYSSNEELLAKLEAGASGYDVIVPSDYMVFAMIKLGLLKELDTNQIPNAKLIDPKYLKAKYDPENKFSLPYDWGTTGIAVNRTLYSGQVKSWKTLFTSKELQGKFSLLDDSREVISAALRAQGLDPNSKHPEDLQKAKMLVLQARERVKAFTSEPLMPLVQGEIAVAHIFMSDALQARKMTGGKIDYIIPEEGSTFWVDNLVIPKTSPHLKEAHALINFLFEGTTSIETVKNIMVAPTNKETYQLLPKEFKENAMLFPAAAILSKCSMLQDLGEDAVIWDRIWTEIKAVH